MTTDELVEAFELLETWEERYRFILDLGKELPELTPEEMAEKNRVHGCQANVWLVAEHHNGTMSFRADSDAHIVKGLIAILMVIFSGKPIDHILQYDVEKLFSQLELREHITSTRNNGLHAMIKRIRQLAAGETEAPAEQGVELN
jgi:cysteine desulfuration protein SufE